MEEQIQHIFKMPIQYNSQMKELNSTISEDLELSKCREKDCIPINNHVFNPTNCLGEIMIPKITQFYTTDKMYLKDTQKLVKQINGNETTFSPDSFFNKWKELKSETSFCEKYLYVDWDHAKFLNNNSSFLQALSMYNIVSPLISLFLPIFILIIPFLIIKLKGQDINLSEYISVLKVIISNHALGKNIY